MTQNFAADPARTDPTGVFITGPTGFGTTALAREFAVGARESGADVRVLDTLRGALAFKDLNPTYSHGMVETAVEALQHIFRQPRPEQPTVFIFDDLAATLRREDRADAVTDQEKLDLDDRNRVRDQLADFVADAFVFGSDVGIFPVVVAPSTSSLRLIDRVKQASNGWVHFEFTAPGSGVLQTEHDKTGFTSRPSSAH
jgi:SpoVK/Ycf46/Vps4 family AAA+-type ATPase